MHTPAEALQAILDCVAPLPPELQPLSNAFGLAAAEDLHSLAQVPPFTNSAMDGYAVRAEDLGLASAAHPVRLRVTGDLAAGGVPEGPLGAGEALRIMTGAPVPEGADTIVPVEETTRGDDWVELRSAAHLGTHIRRAGEDLTVGQRLVPAGQGLRPGDIGALAAAGLAQVPVHRRVHVAILTTGDELVDVSEVPGPGQIRDANLHALSAQVHSFGALAVPYPRIPDDRAALIQALEAARTADVVLTTGGISVGDYDFMKALLEGLGARRVFWKVAQKPGGPLGFWMLGDTPIFGIPGNPVAAMLMVEAYVRPALRKLMGFTHLCRPTEEAILEDGWKGKAGDPRTTFLRVVARREGSQMRARLTGPQGSAILSSMLSANALAVIPPGVDRVPPGGQVSLQLTEEPEDH